MLDLRIIKTCGGFLYQGWSHSSASKPLVQNKVDAELCSQLCIRFGSGVPHQQKVKEIAKEISDNGGI